MALFKIPFMHFLCTTKMFNLSRFKLFFVKSQLRGFCSSPKHWNILFFGSDHFSLPALKALHNTTSISLSVVAPPDKTTYSKTYSPTKQYAIENGINLFQPEQLSDWSVPTTQSGEAYHVGIVSSYGYFIPERVINSFKYGGMCIHPSILPFYRGGAPLERQVERGDLLSGVSIISLDTKKFDAGLIYLQWIFQNNLQVDFNNFSKFLAERGAQGVIEILDNFDKYNSDKYVQKSINDKIEATQEPPELKKELSEIFDKDNFSKFPIIPKGSTYQPNEGLLAANKRPLIAKIIKNEEKYFNWKDLTAAQVFYKWKALSSRGCFTFFQKGTKLIRITLLEFVDPAHSPTIEVPGGIPGSMWYNPAEDALRIQCKDTSIICSALVFEGKKQRPAKDIANGYLKELPNHVGFCVNEK